MAERTVIVTTNPQTQEVTLSGLALATEAETIAGTSDTKAVTPAALASMVTGELVAARDALLHDTYTTKGTTSLTTADSGQTWQILNTGTVALSIISGMVGSTGAGRGYFDADMNAEVTRIGARWEWETGSVSEGTVGILVWATHILSAGTVPDSPCHISISRTGLAYSVYENNSPTTLLSHSFDRLLALETDYECEVYIYGSTATVRSPDGAVLTVTDPLISTLEGDVAGFECFQEAPADMLPRFQQVWADTRETSAFSAMPHDGIMRAAKDAADRAVKRDSTNTAVGAFTHRFLESGGVGNTAFGANAHADLTTGDSNTAIGLNVQTNITTASNNVGVGSNAQATVITASANVAVGTAAQLALTTGIGDVAVGHLAQTALTEGISNTAVGYQVQDALTDGDANTAIGAGAQGALTTGSNNVAVGSGAQAAITDLSNAVAVGTNAQAALTSGTNNTAVGTNAQNAVTSAGNNTAVGTNAQLLLATGSGANTAVGYAAEDALTTGHSNTAVGSDALGSISTGTTGTAVGTSALRSATGNNNTAVGANAGYVPGGVANASTTATRQTMLGAGSGLGSSSQDNDITTIGYQALGTGTGATALGSGAHAAHADGVALGMGAVTTADNQVQIDDRHIEMSELSGDPAAPGATAGRFYLKDGVLCARFNTGSVRILAREAPQTGYTTFTNLASDRTCDANATTVEELADILGTLIEDLKANGIISA